MATQNYMTNYSGAESSANYQGGSGVRKSYLQSTVGIANGDAAGSTYLLSKNMTSDIIITSLAIENDAIAGATSASIGLYDSVTGLALNSTCYAAALNLSTANLKSAPLDGMVALTHDLTLQQLWALLGLTAYNKKGCYDLVMTLNNAATASGFVTSRLEITPAG